MPFGLIVVNKRNRTNKTKKPLQTECKKVTGRRPDIAEQGGSNIGKINITCEFMRKLEN